MSKFASGKNALGISDRSGFAYPLHKMKKEWNGLLVGYDEWEAKHPQLTPNRKVNDPQALKNPRPDQAEALNVYVLTPIPEITTFIPVISHGRVGAVTVTTA
tara:strand:- start:42 stop:347 length:306 start_codon:yes stop_codon:yes gene_type:complete